MNTTLQAPMVTAAYAELAAAGPQDHINRNTAIVLLHDNGESTKEIAAAAGLHPDTARRIIRTFAPDMSVVFAIEEAAREITDAEAEALETPAAKAKATKAAKAAAAQAAKDAEFEAAAADVVAAGKVVSEAAAKAPRIPKFSVEVGGEHYVTWSRKTRNGDELTVAQPQAIGADPEAGKWVTRCDKHGAIAYAESQKIARDRTAAEFCTGCQKAAADASA